MNGEGFAFACWCRLEKFTHEGFGWGCAGCVYEWAQLQNRFE